MTQEEYEIKVQSMPHELQKSLRESLEITASRRIVNRFMSTVMQAYACGQRACITQHNVDENVEYNRGAVEMLLAIKDVSHMSAEDIYQYFEVDAADNLYGLLEVVNDKTSTTILAAIDAYRKDKENEKEKRKRAEVKEMADKIGVENLCRIAEEIRKEEELPH